MNLKLNGKLVKELREKHGYTLKSFSKKTEISKSHLCRIECEEIVNVKLETVFLIAEALNIDWKKLVSEGE